MKEVATWIAGISIVGLWLCILGWMILCSTAGAKSGETERRLDR